MARRGIRSPRNAGHSRGKDVYRTVRWDHVPDTLAHAEMRAMPSSAGYPSAEQAGLSHVLVDDGGLDVGDLGP